MSYITFNSLAYDTQTKYFREHKNCIEGEHIEEINFPNNLDDLDTLVTSSNSKTLRNFVNTFRDPANGNNGMVDINDGGRSEAISTEKARIP
jgi:hypothetical protein